MPRPYFDMAAIRRMWDASSPDMRALLTVMYGGGLRISEALGLDRRHLDLVTGEILVEQQMQIVELADGTRASGIRHETKTHEPRRVWLDDEQLAVIRAYLKRHPGIGGDLPIFLNERGTRLSKNRVYRDFAMIRVDAGVTEARPHDLRHSSLTHLMQAGASWADLKAWSGDKDDRSIARYLHTDEERLKSLARRRSAATA